MINDPIVDEVRETRRRIFEECGNDLNRLIERLKTAEVQHKGRLVSFEEVQKQAGTPKAAI
jgi:hypothetical protein